MPSLSEEERRALRDEVFRVYGCACARCGENDRRVLHLHHVDGRGGYWRRVATLKDPRAPGAVGSHDRELLQLKMDGWPVGWFVTVCLACHATEHGLSPAVVAGERQRMARVTGNGNVIEMVTVTRPAAPAWEVAV